MTTVNSMHQQLTAALQPTQLEIVDQSHLHVGHAGAVDGKGHFAVNISSEKFSGQSRIACHRMIYEALGKLMQNNIHALKINIHD